MYKIDIDEEKRIIKKQFKNELKELAYWRKIRKRFKTRAKMKIETFELQFKHDIKSDIVYDDELKIEAFADEFGYEIVNEEIKFDRSIYVFKKKQK